MLIHLPPSEGKTPPADGGDALDLSALTLPELAAPRREVLDALAAASSREDAQKVLKVGANVMGEVAANTRLDTAPTAPAHRLYTGVLYDALDADTLDEAARARAEDQVLIFSGLFGVTGFSDPIPAHRLSMGVTLAPEGRGPGRLSTFWKQALAEPLDAVIGDQLVVDCRSSAYAVHRAAAEQTLTVNSVTERDGERKVVTHFAKHARGRLTGMLLRAERPAETIDDVAEIAASVWEVEVRPAAGRTPHQLDLISRE
ncbi:peroxide stress protein YaaA [Nesterenkonia halobia]|uniref:Peroxide stress protein YaaA n=1 Tax=Nesterenkonia halobia TaxID=37922 RepID=A0ABP6RBD2_9MICC